MYSPVEPTITLQEINERRRVMERILRRVEKGLSKTATNSVTVKVEDDIKYMVSV